MKTRKRVLAVLLCAAMLLLGGCAGPGDDTPSPTVSREEGTSSAVSQTESALEASATVQPASPEASQLEESSQAESSASEETTSSAPEAAAPETTAAPTTTTPQAAPSTQTTACQHSFHDEGYSGSCSQPGRHIYVCTKCGYTEYGEETPPQHDGKYICEVCGLPLRDGGPAFNRHCLYEWITQNGTYDDIHGYTYRWDYIDANGAYYSIAASCSQWGTLELYYYPTDGRKLNSVLREGSNSIEFYFYGDYASGNFTIPVSQLSHSMAVMADGFSLDSDAPENYTQEQFQNEFAATISQMLDTFNGQLLPQVEFHLADLGFTSW